MRQKMLLDLADVAVAVKDEAGKAKLHRAGNLWAEGTALQGFVDRLPI